MDARPSAIDRGFQSESIFRRAMEIPPEFIGISFDLLQIPAFVLLPLLIRPFIPSLLNALAKAPSQA
jgi:hypothetical protein